jgi:spore germination cell wall hydrolase CwlJ-like protein
MSSTEIDILARTIYGEARSEYMSKEGGLASLIAIGNVIMNRRNLYIRYGKSIQEVCHKPGQFSCWNANDRNRVVLCQKEINDSIFMICREVAVKVSSGEWPDLTKGSDHYHATYLNPFPNWTKGTLPKIRIGKHIFYQLTKED